jgi:hypothetical protein
MQALEFTDPIPELGQFLGAILPHAQAYDRHLKASLRICMTAGISNELLFALFQPVPFDPSETRHVRHGIGFFEFFVPLLKPVSEIPARVVEVYVRSFLFVEVHATNETMLLAMELLKLFVEKNAAAVVAVMDADFENFAKASLIWIVTILELVKERRPLLTYCAPTPRKRMPGTLIPRILAADDSPARDNVEALISFVDHPEASKDCRRAAWRLLEEGNVPADQVLAKAAINVHLIGRKARLALQLPPDDRNEFLLLVSLNSFEAVALALDVIPDWLLQKSIAELILARSFMPKTAVRPVTFEAARKIANYAPLVHCKRMPAAPVIRYGRAVAEALGHETLCQIFAWFAPTVVRNLNFVNAVLEAPKKKALTDTHLDPLIGQLQILRDLRLPFDSEPAARLARALADPEIVTLLEYQNAPALAAVAQAFL